MYLLRPVHTVIADYNHENEEKQTKGKNEWNKISATLTRIITDAAQVEL